MLHTPLTEKQQEIYDSRNDIEEEIRAYESDEYTAEMPEPGAMPEMEEEDFHVKTIDMGKFNTINLQKALAESMRELMGDDDNDVSGQKESITRKLVQPMMDEYPEEEYYEQDYVSEEYPADENYAEGEDNYSYEGVEELEEEPYEEGYYEQAPESYEGDGEQPLYEEEVYEDSYDIQEFEYIIITFLLCTNIGI